MPLLPFSIPEIKNSDWNKSNNCSEGADMVFQNGNIPWNKGKPLSEETKNKIAISRKLNPSPLVGRYVRSEATRKKLSDAIKNLPEEVKLRVNLAKEGVKKSVPRSEEHRKKISHIHKEKIVSEETRTILRQRAFEQFKLKGHPCKGLKASDATKEKISLNHADFKREKSARWTGGDRVSSARQNNKRRELGFVLITDKNPYNEPIEYHHIHPTLPYVITCPRRIHRMFDGSDKGKTHYQNVNAMLGFKIVLEDILC